MKNDLISRTKAVEEVSKALKGTFLEYEDIAEKIINKVPSAQPDVPDINVGDMISRQAALDALGERPMLWVDDDNYTLGARNQYDMDRLAIETVPSVDAVPVVRCRNCRFSQRINEWVYECYVWNDDRMFNRYCDMGERKDGDEHEVD